MKRKPFDASIMPPATAAPPAAPARLRDALDRPLRDLRISVTDRCNFRCLYCMPREIFGQGYPFLRRDQILTFEEIHRVARILVDQGVTKIRLTGGEPLLRHDLERLVGMLASLPGVDLTLTTNGSAPPAKVRALQQAGLRRMTVSLDSLEESIFRAMNDVNFSVARVLAWIETAAAADMAPLKINMVVKRGVNEDSIVPMARYFRARGHVLRFIEYMDVGNSNAWRMADVVTAAEILARLDAVMPLEPVTANYRGEVARRYRYRDGNGEIGIIASVTQAFCRDCTRLRLSTAGELYTCLFAARGHDLRPLLRGEASDAELAAAVAAVWRQREDRYSEQRREATATLHKIEMSYIGG